MDPNAIGQVGLLLASLGAALQWLRAQQSFPEWAYYAAAVVLTLGGCYLATNGTITDWRAFLLDSWPIFLTLLGATLGGNAVASNAAKAAVARGANEKNVLIPLTDSKP